MTIHKSNPSNQAEEVVFFLEQKPKTHKMLVHSQKLKICHFTINVKIQTNNNHCAS